MWEYENIANNLVAGRGYTYDQDGTPYVAKASSPLYVLLTAAVYAITDHNHAVMMVAQAVFGGLTAALVTSMVARSFPPGAAWAAGGLVAIDPALALYAAKLHPLSLDALGFVAIACMAVALPAGRGSRRFAKLGVTIGLAALTRPTALVLTPMLILWSSRYRGLRVLSPAAVALVAVAVLVYAPWPIRNSLLLGELVPSSSEASEWLWRGTNPAATGSPWTNDGRTMLQAAPENFQRRIAATSEGGRISLYFDAAVQFIRDNPRSTATLYLEKLKAFWWGSNATGSFYPSQWSVLYGAWYLAILLMAAVGIWRAFREPATTETAALVLSTLVLVSLTQAVFYVEGRHRLAVEPLLLVMSGPGLNWLAVEVARRFRIERGLPDIRDTSTLPP
jgi:4-amino-4-deoxy-L-arabinose transferase-like glycosyltransferase